MTLLVLCFGVVAVYNNCGGPCGTNTGNPFSGGGSCNRLVPPSAGPIPPTPTIAPAMCAKLKACFRVFSSTCENQILAAPNMSAALGVNPAQYPTYSSVLDAANSGLLKVESSNFTVCETAINNLLCASSIVQNSYNTLNPNFDNVYKLLQADLSCSQIYR